MIDSFPPQAPVQAVPSSPGTVSRLRLWAHVLLVVPIPLVLGLLAVGRHHSRHAALTETWRGLLAVCGVDLVIFGIILSIALRLSKTTMEDMMVSCGRPWRALFLGAAYSVALRIGIALVVTFVAGLLIVAKVATVDSLQTFTVAHRPDVESLVNLQALTADPAYFWLTLTLVSFVMGGLREELWRTASLTGLGKVWPWAFGTPAGQYRAVFLTSLLFGMGHVSQGLLAAGLTTVIGFFLGAIMVRHRSIWPAVIAHGFFDATSFAALRHYPEILKITH